MILLQPLSESLSAVVFHNTSLRNLFDIVKSDRFYLTTNLGTSSDQLSSKFYYLSVSRIKFGGYARSMSENGLVNIVLDGKKLNQRYKGGPVDYWGQELRSAGTSAQKLRNDENEERVLSDDPVITSALNYILSIHVSLVGTEKEPDMDELGSIMMRNDYYQMKSMAQVCHKKGIPVYFYTDFSAFKTLNTRKAIDIYSNRLNLIDSLLWIVSHCKEVDDIPDKYPFSYFRSAFHEPKYINNRDDAVIQLNNDIHNSKATPEGRESIAKLTALMRKEKVRNTIDLLKKIGERLTQ